MGGADRYAAGADFDGTIDLNQNVTARYVKLDVEGGAGAGNHGSSGWAGLAEIQVFGRVAADTPAVTDQIALSSGSATCSETGYGSLDAIINGAGLTGEAHAEGYGSNQFMAKNTDQVQFTFDLCAGRKLEAMKIWNFNDNSYGKAGLRTVDILVANQADFSDAEVAYNDIELTMPTNMNGYDNPFLINLKDSARTGTDYRYVRISTIGNSNPTFGATGTYLTGLAEVQFFQTYVPEPATMVLLASGAAGIAALRRRRR